MATLAMAALVFMVVAKATVIESTRIQVSSSAEAPQARARARRALASTSPRLAADK